MPRQISNESNQGTSSAGPTSGAQVTDLSASNIATGTLANARLPANVAFNSLTTNDVATATASISMANIATATMSTANVGSLLAETSTLANATLANATLSTANVSSLGVEAANIAAANISHARISTANVTTASISAANVTSLVVGGANVATTTISVATIDSLVARTSNLSSTSMSAANVASLVAIKANVATLEVNAAKCTSLESASAQVTGEMRAGTLAGNGAFITNLQVSEVTGLEARLAKFASATRLYVSTSGSDANAGTSPDAPLRTIKKACQLALSGTTIFVETGQYTEQNPIVVGSNVAIVGDNLRRVLLTAANPRLDYFHVNNLVYLWGLRFVNLQRPAFCVAFPCATAESTIMNGQLTGLQILYSPVGYSTSPTVIIDPPDAGTTATATAVVTGGVVVGFTITNPGSGYTERPHVSIHAPSSQRPFITGSPYVQNCSSITGPFDADGVLVSAATPLPYDITNIGGTGRRVDTEGAGGGIRIDGIVCHPASPLRSFVADAFTQVNQGGPGHLCVNLGYAQFVSCFTTFCTYSFKAASGSYCNISNSVSDFGLYGLVAKGYWRDPFTTALVTGAKTSSLSAITVNAGGSGYSSPPTVVLTGGGGSGATATAQVDLGKVVGIVVTDGGSGYTSAPTVSFTGGGGSGAEASATLSGTGPVRLTFQSARAPDIGSIAYVNGAWLTVVGATPTGSTYQYDVSMFPSPLYAADGASVPFHMVSSVSTGSHVMEYVGSGVTYNALPEYGGVPVSGNEILEVSPGRCYYTTSDHLGNSKVGKFFQIEQATGTVTISTDKFNLSGLNSIGPFRRNGVGVGVQLQEVSNNPNMISSTGAPDATTVPTQTAVKTYIDNRSVPSAGFTSQVLAKRSNNDYDIEWQTLNRAIVGLANVADVLQLAASEKAAANGVATLDTIGKLTSTQLPSTLNANIVANSLVVANQVAYFTTGSTTGDSGIQFSNAAYQGPLIETRQNPGQRFGIGSYVDTTRVYTGSLTASKIALGYALGNTAFADVLTVARNGTSLTNNFVGINKTPTCELDVNGNVATGNLRVSGKCTLDYQLTRYLANLTTLKELVVANAASTYAVDAGPSDSAPPSLLNNQLTPGYGSIYFAGTDAVTVPALADWNWTSEPWSMEFWFYMTEAPPSTFVGMGFVGTDTNSLKFGVRNNSGSYQAGIHMAKSGGYSTIVHASRTFALNTWNHVAVNFNGLTAVTLVLNGVVDGSSYNGPFPSARANVFTIGKDLKGYIAAPRVVRGAIAYTSDYTPRMPYDPVSSGNVALLSYVLANSSTKECTIQSGNVSANVLNAVDSITTAGSCVFGSRLARVPLALSSIPTIVVSNVNAVYSVDVVPAMGRYDLNSGTDVYGSAYFTGQGGITVPSLANWRWWEQTPFTIEFWEYSDSAFAPNETRAVVTLYKFGILFHNLNGVRRLSVRVDSNDGANYNGYVIKPINSGWNHIALMVYYDIQMGSYSFTVYVNGAYLGVQTVNSSNIIKPGASTFGIGTDTYTGLTSNYRGYITGLRVTKGTRLYTTNFTPGFPYTPATSGTVSFTMVPEIIIQRREMTCLPGGNVSAMSMTINDTLTTQALTASGTSTLSTLNAGNAQIFGNVFVGNSVQLSNAYPGTLVERRYGNATERYGVHQSTDYTTRLFCASSNVFAKSALSFATSETSFYDGLVMTRAGTSTTPSVANVGINTPSPTAELHVVGNVLVSGGGVTSTNGVQITGQNALIEKRYGSATDRYGIGQYSDNFTRVYASMTTGTAKSALSFALGETTFLDGLVVARNGTSTTTANVGINTSAPEDTLHVVGNVRVDGRVVASGEVVAFSDRRLKTNVVVVDNALEKLAKLTGYTYDRIDMPGRFVGVMAQDVRDVLPEAVHDANGTLGVAYNGVCALLVEALKEQARRIDTLELALGLKV